MRQSASFKRRHEKHDDPVKVLEIRVRNYETGNEKG
jgi:hypothetical protein